MRAKRASGAKSDFSVWLGDLKGNRKGAIKLEERLNGIRCIEEKLRAKGIAL